MAQKQTSPKFDEKDIERREWRFGMHLPVGPEGQDLHLIKELITLKDGTKTPNMRVISNFRRPVWCTKPNYRTHVDKKEYESLDKLDQHMTTQSQLRNKVAMLVGRPSSPALLGELLTNPYIYGADISAVTMINRELYQKPNEGKAATPYRVGCFDTETDVLYGTNSIIIGSMTIWPYCHLVIREDWLAYKGADVVEQIKRNVLDTLNPVLEKFFASLDAKTRALYVETELKFSFEIVKDEITLVEKSFEWFHREMPDWMAIWSLDFDVTKILEACERANVDPKTILADKRIPPEYRVCRYKRSQTLKEAASGKLKPVSPHDQWHTLFLSASFYPVDAMSTYRLLRLGEQEERSYGLDAIMDKEFKGALRKLTYAPADKYVKEKWHQVMQRDHKFMYLPYAALDTIGMCLLDIKIRDLSHKLPSLAGITHFSECNSQPKRLRDAFYIFALEDHRSVIGSVGFNRDKKPTPEPEVNLGEDFEESFDDMDDDDEDEAPPQVLGRKGWVLTLGSHFSAIGLRLIKGCRYIWTGIRGFVYDSDAVSSYPSCAQVANVSKVTTRKEICKVGDLDEPLFRNQGLNLIFGTSNALEYTTKMFNAPSLKKLLDIYDTRKAAKK